MRAAGLADREAELAAGLEALRAELGPLTLDVGAEGGAPAERARKLEEELGEIEAGLSAAGDGLARARAADASESAREAALGAVRSGAERASRHARRAEGLLGERHREMLRKRLAGGEELLADVQRRRRRGRRGRGRDPGPGRAHRGPGRRRRGRRRRDRRGDARLLAARVRAPGRDESRLRRADRGRGRGRPPRRPPRRGGQGAGLDRRAPRRGGRAGRGGARATRSARRSTAASSGSSAAAPRSARSTRWPSSEYEEAREHVESLQAQREDTERGMRELEALIRDIDREIERAFEETFEATARNFEEMVEHLFPGGRGAPAPGHPAAGPRRGAPGGRAGGADGRRRAGARGGRAARGARGRDRGHPGRQVDPQALAALRRREVARRARLRLRRLPRPALPLLHPRRGRGGPRRRQHRPLPAARPALLRPRPVRDRHPPETDDGRRRRPLRGDDGRRRRDQGRLPPPAPRGRVRRGGGRGAAARSPGSPPRDGAEEGAGGLGEPAVERPVGPFLGLRRSRVGTNLSLTGAA